MICALTKCVAGRIRVLLHENIRTAGEDRGRIASDLIVLLGSIITELY